MLKRKPLLSTILVALLPLLLFGVLPQIQAQSRDDLWQPPVNLSRSGAAGNPTMVVAAQGAYYLFWQDELLGNMVVVGDGETWQDPVAARVPFSEPAFAAPGADSGVRFFKPTIVATADDRLHAFWLDEDNRLQYSRVVASQVAAGSDSWTPPLSLAPSALAISVATENNRIHLTYVRPNDTADFPTGIYHRRSEDGGGSWTDAAPLYTSAYLRATPAEEQRLQTVVGGDGVHVAWDVPLLEAIYYTRSTDNGATWAEPLVIDKRDADAAQEAPGPAMVTLQAADEEVHLAWRVGVGQAINCRQYHQVSTDSGATWSLPQIVRNDTVSCPENIWLLADGDARLFLLTATPQTFLLQTWNGSQWSEAVAQDPLTRLTNPDTFREVNLGCQRPVVVDQMLSVAACTVDGVAEVWWRQRPLGDSSLWEPYFSGLSPWKTAVPAAERDLIKPILLDGGDGQFHALWIGRNLNLEEEDGVTRSIFYALWNGGSWTRPAPVVNTQTDQLDAVRTPNGQLLLVWRDLLSGSLMSSQVNEPQARVPADWSEPMPVSPPEQSVGSPQLLQQPDGSLLLGYLVTLNEGRGGYLQQSRDQGRTWSAPVQIFDAAAAGWEMVGQLSLAQAPGGRLHAMWVEHSALSGPGPLALHSSHSLKDGADWSEPVTVIEGEVVGQRVAAAATDRLFRVWLQKGVNQIDLWYQSSADDGVTWERPVVLASTLDMKASAQITADAFGRLHVFLATERSGGRREIKHWLWDGNRWSVQDSLFLPETSAIQPANWTAVAGIDGILGLLYPSTTVTEEGEDAIRVDFAQRSLAVPDDSPVAAGEAVSLPTPTAPAIIAATENGGETSGVVPAPATATVVVNGEATATIEPDPTPTPPMFDSATNNGARSSSAMQIAVGTVPTLLFITVVAGFYFVRFRRK